MSSNPTQSRPSKLTMHRTPCGNTSKRIAAIPKLDQCGADGQSSVQRPSAIAAMTTDTPLYDMAEELAGKGRLRPPGNALCKMVYPTGHKNWHPPRGHLDGYLIEGVADTFTIAVTINISRVLPRGGGFTTWAGSHLKVAGYFQRHALTHLSGLKAPGFLHPAARYEHAAPAGTVCFWHHYMLHTASMNCQKKHPHGPGQSLCLHKSARYHVRLAL